MSATTLTYSKLITTNIANQAVSLAESGVMGHRVQVPMSVNDLNRFFVWNRPAGTSAPVGHFQQVDASGVNFNDMMLASLGKTYTDVDGVTNGLNFSSAVLDANTDPRIRLNGQVSANDVCMAYMLYKCYGSSAAPTANVIYNLEDAQSMLTSGTLVLAIDTSLAAEEVKSNNPSGSDKGAVHAMFADLLAADPTRFFTAAGIQIPGLFEVAADFSSSGSWGFVENDKIEMRVQFTFTSAVTRTGVQDPDQNSAGSTNMRDTSTSVITAGSTFTIRLQITATDTPSGAAIKAAASATAQASADAQKQQAAAQAVSNAVKAAASAQQAVSAAMSQKSNADAAVARLIATNAAQATAVSNANAALEAAQAALAAAQVSGNQANIQQQNAAAVAAQAAVANAQAIAKQASADLLTAQTAQANAVANLNAAQAAAANAAAAVANANSAAAAAAQNLAEGAAAAQAAAAAAATAASAPEVNALTEAEKVILNPQTVTTAQAAANVLTQTRLKAQANSVKATADAATATSTLESTSTKLALLISQGEALSAIQIARANVVAATTAQAAAQAAANQASISLSQTLAAELAAQEAASTASAQRLSLIATIANAQVNTDANALTAATTAANATTTAFTAAQTAAAAATTALNAAVASGKTMQEVQTLTATSLAANNALATATTNNNAAQVKLAAAQSVFQKDTMAAAAAQANITSDAVSSAQAMSTIKTNLTLATNYQNNVVFLATVNTQSQNVNATQVAMFKALVNMNNAQVAQTAAENNLTAATTAGGTAATLSSLQQALQEASNAFATANNVYNSALNIYNIALSELKTTANEVSVVYAQARARVEADNAAFTAAQTAAASAASALSTANTALATAAATLRTTVNSTNISAYQDKAAKAVTAALADKNAKLALEAATATLATDTLILTRGVFGIFDASGNQIVLDSSGNPTVDATGSAILQAAAAMQLASITDAKATSLVTTYVGLVAAYNTARVEADAAAQQADSAEKALTNAITAGLPLAQLTALSVTTAAAQAASSKAANAATLANAAALNSLGAMYMTSSAGPSGAAAITVLSSTLALQTSTALAAHNNEIVVQLTAAYKASSDADAAVVADKYAVYLANAALTSAVAGGATVANIKQLQAVVQAANTILAKDTQKAAQKAAALVQQKSWASLVPSTAAITDTARTAANAATRASAINVLVSNYMDLKKAQDAATTALNSAQNTYNLNNAALNAAITQGTDLQAIQAARATVQVNAADLANAQTVFNLAVSSVTQSYNNLLGKDASGNIINDASGNPLADASGNSVNQAALAILTNGVNVQKRAIADANANSMVQLYTNSFAQYQISLTAFQTAQAAAQVANNNLDQAITAGAEVAEIQSLRITAQSASAALATAKTTMDNALEASNDSYADIVAGMTFDASGNPVSDGSGNVLASQAAVLLLLQQQANQAQEVANATSNSLMQSYIVALNTQTAANNALSNSQAAYDAAAAALNQAITGGADVNTIQTLQVAAQSAGQVVANDQTASNAAASAVTLALQQVNANNNATAIIQQVQLYQSKAAALALANNFINLLAAAQAKVVAKLNEVTLANNASSIAAAALDAAIASGSDIANIQALQRTVVAEAAVKAAAQVAYDQALAQLSQAQASATANSVASIILNNQAVFAAMREHAAAINAAQNAVTTATATNAAAQANLTAAQAARTAAQAAVTTATGAGATPGEIADLQAAAASAATAAAAAANTAQVTAADLMTKRTSLAAVTANNISTPNLAPSAGYYQLNCVGLNETQVDASGTTIYVNDAALVAAANATGSNAVNWTTLALGVQGAGVTGATKIVSVAAAISVPGGLYPATTCVAIRLDRQVSDVDAVFYIVGGKIALQGFLTNP